MNTQPLVSIIIPFYNAEKYLKRCLDSIATQDYKNLEILPINDGSEDNSQMIANNYAQQDNRVHPVTLSHGGVSIARNEGLSVASGDYIMFVDADDWIGPGIIGRMMKTLLSTGTDLVTCNIKHMARPEEKPPAYVEGYTICNREEYIRVFFRIGSNQYVHYPVAKIYKKELLQNPLYPPGIRVGEDVLGTYRAIRNIQTIARMNEIGYFYFYSPESATASFGEKDFDLLSVWDMVAEEAKDKEPDATYAELDKKRINFSLLFRLVTEVPSRERKLKYSEKEKVLKNDLKLYEKDLLQAPIVRSRKILIFLLCHFYPLMAFAGNAYQYFRKFKKD